MFIDTPNLVHNDNNKEISSNKVSEFIKDHVTRKSVSFSLNGLSVTMNAVTTN